MNTLFENKFLSSEELSISNFLRRQNDTFKLLTIVKNLLITHLIFRKCLWCSNL